MSKESYLNLVQILAPIHKKNTPMWECVSAEERILIALRYGEKLEDNIKKAIKEGPKSIEFTQLVEWLSKELQILCNLESCVNAILDVEDSSSFLLELSSFLRELNCPHKILTEGPINQRLCSETQCSILLDYLCVELQAARIISARKSGKRRKLEIEIDESTTACDLKDILVTLNMDNPEENVNPKDLLNNIENKIKDITLRVPANHLSTPLLNSTLTESQWSLLQSLQKNIDKEFHMRRQMLLTRLDVTIQSFKWGERLKDKGDEIMNIYLPLRKQLEIEPSVEMADVMAAREDTALILKTSCSEVTKNNQTETYRHVMGLVPDRGGRPKEQYPAREMPNWKKRTEGSAFGGRGRGNRGGQGSWSGKGKKFAGNKRQAFDAAGSYGH